MPNIFLRALRCLVLAALALGQAVTAHAVDDTGYTIAIVPSAPPITMNAKWTPFVERLAKETGLKFRLKHYERMAEFERDIWSGTPDFIFSSPIQLVVAHTSRGYIPLVRGEKPIAMGLFVRKDSSIRSLDDLIGKKISFVGNKNICSVFMRHLLARHDKELSFETEYAGSTRNVIINVLLGKSDAGAVFMPEMNLESEETRSQLREIVKTSDVAPHPLSVHPRVPQKLRDAVTKSILAITDSDDGAALLKSVNLPDPVAANYPRDYKAMEAIDIKGLTNWGQ
ncbi:MAG: phosphate/phosphite/phosphonate ABC transporter substrate-binding protein [Rhodocyclales bacterium]|nr:phosphate/phosphite/phosphonate ABC transporter substrate-binding protein [Rhodocyclales bacterium]